MPEETLRENKMGTMPENKLLLSMAVPMMISMLVQALYNIVDSIFVSRICEDALTAVSMAFPLQNIIISTLSASVSASTRCCRARWGRKTPSASIRSRSTACCWRC